MLRPAVAILLALATTGAIGLAAPPAAAAPPDVSTAGLVLIDELANGDARSDSNSFVELRNWGDTLVDLTGWRLYRCSGQGLRSNVGRTEGDLSGIVLAPGGIVTVSRVGMPGDRHITQPFALEGFGLYLESPGAVLADRVGVFPNEPWPTQSECSPGGGNLPNVLDFSHDESWQRVGATGDVAADWIIGTSTIGEHNTISAEQRAAGDIVISELAGAGPAGDGDDFVELRNDGDTAVDLGGWTLDRCTASGRLRPAGRELVVPAGTELRPGATWLAAGPGYAPDGASAPDGRYDTSLADVEFGVLLRDGDGRLADRVAVSQYDDSACQGEGSKLPAILDAAAGESWQRAAHGWIVARRTPGAPNATAQASLFETPFFYPTRLGVAISEIATDPAPDALPPGATQRNWIELGNYGDTAVDVGGWTLWRCQADGARGFTPQVTIAAGTTIQPGSTFLAARSGTAAAAHADATYGTALNFLGSGVWLADATGRRIDSAGIYGQNEMDESIVVASPCTKGAALTTYQPDRMLGETFQRTQFTGVDDDDFVTAVATPGVIDQIPWADPTMRVPGVIAPGDEPAEPVVTGAVGIQGATGVRAQIAKTAPVLERRLAIVGAWAGASAGPLTTERTDGEVTLDAAALAAGALGAIGDDGYDFPYQRLVLDGGGLDAGDAIGWSGTTQPRQEVQVSAWNAGAWRLIGAAAGDPESGAVEVGGTLEEGDFRDGRVTLLVQDGPRTVATIASGIDGRLQDPGAYDFAISHITDTQYMTEDYPQYYAQLVSWIADHADDRKIAFATHTGDIVQNWVDPDQPEDRARREFETASAIQAILDDVGVPNSVLPGNHDSKRGVDRSLFNDYFPVSRYAGQPWFGGSIAPDDNSANYSTFERAGARVLMLSLPYAYGETEIAWASDVVTSHPDYNVVISTHEYVTAKTVEVAAGHSVNSRWVSHGGQLWDEVIAPNRNVVLVLAGHFHGVGQIVNVDAGGISGHTVVEMLADYQEFRTHTGERGTGFQRLLQIDLASGTVAVDTFSARLDAAASFPYDYRQFVPDNGMPSTLSNERPWAIVEAGLQNRYTAEDDEFTAQVSFQYEKSVQTGGVFAAVP